MEENLNIRVNNNFDCFLKNFFFEKEKREIFIGHCTFGSRCTFTKYHYLYDAHIKEKSETGRNSDWFDFLYLHNNRYCFPPLRIQHRIIIRTNSELNLIRNNYFSDTRENFKIRCFRLLFILSRVKSILSRRFFFSYFIWWI